MNQNSNHKIPTLQQVLKKFVKNFVWALFFTIIIFTVGIIVQWKAPSSSDFSSVTFPYKLQPNLTLKPYNSSFPLDYTVLLDTHIHSTASDGKLNPRQVAEWAVASGYNAIIVTDHNSVDGALQVKKFVEKDPLFSKQLIVIPGMEYTSCTVHMNFLNINETIPLCSDGSNYCPVQTLDMIKFLVDKVHGLGGWVSINHIPWSVKQEGGRLVSTLPNQPTLDSLIEIGIDAGIGQFLKAHFNVCLVEIVNGDIFDLSSYQKALSTGLGMFTGSDMHYPQKPYAWNIMKPKNFTAESIWEEIVAKRTSFLFDASGLNHFMPTESQAIIPVLYTVLSPLIGIGSYLNTFWGYDQGMYSFQGSFCHDNVVTVDTLAIGMFFVYYTLLLLIFTLLFEILNVAVSIVFNKLKGKFKDKEP
ncbi:hypothetical protein HDU92_006109 [Lobulomyces angularis]|nr:hypothetical protein HDU92_006109 [Lobulomyces angularis]